MDVKNGEKQSFNFSLFFAHGNQFLAKKRVIVYNINMEYGKNLIFVQMSYMHFKNIKRNTCGFEGSHSVWTYPSINLLLWIYELWS